MLYITLLLLAVCVGFIIYIFLRRKKHTREHFAFYALASLMGFAGATILPIFTGNSLLTILEILTTRTLGIEIKPTSDIYDKLLSFAIFFLLVILANRFHKNWGGAVSQRQFDNERRGITTTLVHDAAIASSQFIQKDPIKLRAKDDEERKLKQGQILPEFPITFDWKKRAAFLLKSFSGQYKIDINRDWYQEYFSFIAKFGENELPALIYCPEDSVSSREVKATFNAATSTHPDIKVFTIIQRGAKVSSPDLSGINVSQKSFYTEDMLIQNLSRLTGYRDYVIHEYEERKITSSSSLAISDLYVPSSGALLNGTHVPSVEDYICRWAKSEEYRHLAILGDYGQGKSTIALRLAHEYFKNNTIDRIPVVVELRGKNPRNEDLEQILFPWARSFGSSPEALLALHEAGKLILILEGFDEMDFVGDAEIRMAHFRRLWEFAGYKRAKIIITGRPNFFFDTDELKRALMLSGETEDRPHCTAIRLEPFNEQQVEWAIRKFPESTQKSLLSIVNDPDEGRHHLRDLLGRPSTLIWAATVWDQLIESLNSQQILSESVIGMFLQQSFDRQINKKLTSVILASERQFFTFSIAVFMHVENPGVNQISAASLRYVVETLIDKVPEVLREFATPDEPSLGVFQERFSDRGRQIETVLTDVRTCGVIVEDVARSGYFKFAHKSFYEYYVSQHIAHSLLYRRLRRTRIDGFVKNPFKVASEALRDSGWLVYRGRRSEHEQIAQFSGEILASWFGKVRGYTLHSQTEKERAKQFWEFLFGMASELTRFMLVSFGSPLLMPVSIYASEILQIVAFQIKMWRRGCLAMGIGNSAQTSVVGRDAVEALAGDLPYENLRQRLLYRALVARPNVPF